MTDEPRTRLAQAIRARRLSLRLSQPEASRRAEMARGTWIAAETGTRRTSPHLYAGIETALFWEPGSVEAILGGGTPTEIADDDPRRVVDAAQAEHSDTMIAAIWNSDLDPDDKLELINILLSEREEARAQADRRTLDRLAERVRLRRRYAS